MLLLLACAEPLPFTASAKVDTGWSCASSPCRVMPLGDSITDGSNVPGGYRIELEDLAAADGYTIDFVGSQSNGPADLADQDHEGHGGWRIDQIQAIARIRTTDYDPDIVLIHLGTNDVAQKYLLRGAPTRIQRLVQTIQSVAPDALVVVASIIPFWSPVFERRGLTFNAQIPGVVSTIGGNTLFVDMHAVLTTADIADGFHPDSGGYDLMAAAWYDAIAAYLR